MPFPVLPISLFVLVHVSLLVLAVLAAEPCPCRARAGLSFVKVSLSFVPFSIQMVVAGHEIVLAPGMETVGVTSVAGFQRAR
jgi:hypothetical protein